MDQKKTIRPFSMKDKIGYTLGDLGCCFTEQYRAMYLSIFYTLILQVNPFHVGILLLITKIWDAVNDPIIGAMVDSRKATKGGKFIPWIRAFSFPMAVLCILGFVNVGNINYGLRLAYMFVTYVLYEALYTCVNVPFGTLSSVMTDDVSQRTALSRYRSLGGTIFMTVMVMIGPLFLYVDNKPVAGRFLMLACICAMLGLLCLQITCVWCKERVEVPERPQGEKLNYLHVLKEISHNKALLGVMFFSLTGMIGASVVNGLNTYLYKDFFGNVKIRRVSPSRRSVAEKPSLLPLAVIRAAPTLEVSTTMAFLKSALRPWASVTIPSSMIWSRMPQMSGWAFSISSKSTTQ